jgi:hypothetical protein
MPLQLLYHNFTKNTTAFGSGQVRGLKGFRGIFEWKIAGKRKVIAEL